MSADNGIYILQLRDQYRVLNTRSIENLWWHSEYGQKDQLNPIMVFKYFKECRFTRYFDTAMRVASRMLDDCLSCEYGIRIIACPLTWSEVRRFGESA